MTKVKKYILALLILAAAAAPFFAFKGKYSVCVQAPSERKGSICPIDLTACQENILRYLKLRKDGLARDEIEKVLSVKPDDLCALCALWAKAEVLRRAHKLEESEKLLEELLSKCPNYAAGLISMSYIKYSRNEFTDALRILQRVLKQKNIAKENQALAYVLLGSINSRRASLGGLLSKAAYGLRIKSFFEKAKNIAPELSEVHLALGSFYLLAPNIAGGSIDKAIEELEYAAKLTPDFATVNARLAQAYNKRGDLEKSNFYIRRAKELDPQNDILYEVRND